MATLLFADPDARSAQMVALALRKAGYAVEMAASGGEARRRIGEVKVDAVICEAVPDGLDLCRVLRANKDLAAVPLIVVSADKAMAPRALEAGADEFVRKPFLLRELVQRVRVLLERQELSSGGSTATLTGSIGELGLVDLFQALLAAKRSGSVVCASQDNHARVFVREGEIVDCELGPVTGVAALRRLLTWDAGSYRVDVCDVDRAATIEAGTEAALVDAMRAVEELSRAPLRMTSIYVVDAAQLADRLSDLADEANGIVRWFDGRRTLREVIDLSPVDDLRTVALVQQLLEDGVVKEVAAINPRLSLDDARDAAAGEHVEPLPEVEPVDMPEPGVDAGDDPTAISRAPAPPLVRFKHVRGARRERLRREAEEARAQLDEHKPVRLSRVVELPPWLPRGADELNGERRMSPAVGDAAKKFAPDAAISRSGEPAYFVPPIAPVAPPTPVPVLPEAVTAPIVSSPGAISPGTPAPPRSAAATRRSKWIWAAAGIAVLLIATVALRRGPKTEKAPWIAPNAAVAPAVLPAPAPAVASAPTPAAPASTPVAPEPPQARLEHATPASDLLYAKALEQGEALVRTGKYLKAAAQFQRAVREKPRSVPALLALGDAYLEGDKPRSAVQPLETAVQLDDSSARAHLLLATAYQSLGRNAPAVKSYRRYLQLEPQGEFARDVRQVLANLAR